LQDRRVEAFGEPVVDRREEIASLGALALVAPEAGEAGGGAELEHFCTLTLCYGDGLLVWTISSVRTQAISWVEDHLIS
jgi:hypothetical protein